MLKQANSEFNLNLARELMENHSYRDYLNTPAFFDMLTDVNGLFGLDIGCSEDHNTRLLAERGARMAAINISQVFIQYAQKVEK